MGWGGEGGRVGIVKGALFFLGSMDSTAYIASFFLFLYSALRGVRAYSRCCDLV